MGATSNPVYDLHRYGIAFVASPRHADMIMVTGVVTRNLEQALRMTYAAMPDLAFATFNTIPHMRIIYKLLCK